MKAHKTFDGKTATLNGSRPTTEDRVMKSVVSYVAGTWRPVPAPFSGESEHFISGLAVSIELGVCGYECAHGVRSASRADFGFARDLYAVSLPTSIRIGPREDCPF